MKNLDLIKESREKFASRIFEAARGDKPEEFSQAFLDFAGELQEAIVKEARGIADTMDANVLASRGVRQLTSKEREYYQRIIDASRGDNWKQALTNVDVVMPKTAIDSVFEDIRQNHPLLDAINFQNTGALIEILVSTTSGVGGWGELCDTIDDELSANFVMIPLSLKKYSAYIPVCKAQLDLGPEWLDRYVRELLAETVAAGLELAIADGDGDGKPIGMTRQLTGAVDGVYPRKTPITITKLDPATVGGILNTVSQGPGGKRRAISRLLMVVNPADYYTKVYPATTPRTTSGGYTYDALPFPMTVVPSAGVPEGFAVFGLAEKYFFGLGTSRGGKIEHSDHVRFLEDQRVYLVKLYGNGRPLDENAFVYADISGLENYVLQVEVTNAADFPVA